MKMLGASSASAASSAPTHHTDLNRDDYCSYAGPIPPMPARQAWDVYAYSFVNEHKTDKHGCLERTGGGGGANEEDRIEMFKKPLMPRPGDALETSDVTPPPAPPGMKSPSTASPARRLRCPGHTFMRCDRSTLLPQFEFEDALASTTAVWGDGTYSYS